MFVYSAILTCLNVTVFFNVRQIFFFFCGSNYDIQVNTMFMQGRTYLKGVVHTNRQRKTVHTNSRTVYAP